MTAPTTYPRTRLITGEELLPMGDIGPCELVEGEIVQMSPTNMEHAFLESEIGRLLGNFVVERQLGWVLVGEVGIYTRYNPDSVRAADVAFISKERIPQRLRQGFLKVAPELVVEVVSPGDGWLELHDKIEEYFAVGVVWAWVVEPKNRTIRVYHSPITMQKLTIEDTLQGEGVLEGFVLPLVKLFAD